jgi:hypothetical protein
VSPAPVAGDADFDAAAEFDDDWLAAVNAADEAVWAADEAFQASMEQEWAKLEAADEAVLAADEAVWAEDERVWQEPLDAPSRSQVLNDCMRRARIYEGTWFGNLSPEERHDPDRFLATGQGTTWFENLSPEDRKLVETDLAEHRAWVAKQRELADADPDPLGRQTDAEWVDEQERKADRFEAWLTSPPQPVTVPARLVLPIRRLLPARRPRPRRVSGQRRKTRAGPRQAGPGEPADDDPHYLTADRRAAA